MPIVVVEAVAPAASWRPPEALTYHRTLPLPPYTALVGTLGAALGLGLPAAYRLVAERGLRLGVGGWHEGRARDLWKFQKLESVAEAKPIKTDVLLREWWSDVRLALVVEAPERDVAGDLADAFRRPAFPLTAGASDALMNPVAVRVEDMPPVPARRLAYSLVFGELPPSYRLAEPWDRIPLGRVIRAPSVERLPVGFDFPDGQPRRLRGREPVTFVADPIDLDPGTDPVVGYPLEPRSAALRRSPVFASLEHALPWTIPVHRYDCPATAAARSSTTP